MNLLDKSLANYKHQTRVHSYCGTAAFAYINIENGQPADPISQEIYDFFFSGKNKGKYRLWYNGPRSHRRTERQHAGQKTCGNVPQHTAKADAWGASIYYTNR